MNIDSKQIVKYSYPIRKRKRSKTYNSKKYNDEESDEDYGPMDNENENGSGNPLNFLFGGSEIFIKGNHIWFNTSVTKTSTNKLVRIIHDKNLEYIEVAKALSEMTDMTPKPIYMHINSYGGDLLAVMAVVDAIENSKIPIHTIVEGCSASAGTLMSVVGHHRAMTKNSFMLIHQLSSSMSGKMAEIEDDFQNNKVFMSRIKDIYERKTNMRRSEITEALVHDIWWDAKKCLKKGLIDEIV